MILKNTTPKRGSVALVPFPFTDLSGAKVRPAVVVSEKLKGADVILIFISSITKNQNGFDVLISEKSSDFKKTGLKTESLVKCDKIATLEKKVLLGEIGILPPNTMQEISKKLKQILGL
ncbi:MAG: type II toxin-antitoxin system PemK/MazF family toxin [bacterium]|nr:type II toxin-antitoxin system PemK/MazF family toxin [bacterium]